VARILRLRQSILLRVAWNRRLRLYSQALFRAEDESLEDAAENKLDAIMRACRLAAGSSVLEVGSAGLVRRAMLRGGVDVHRCDILPEQ